MFGFSARTVPAQPKAPSQRVPAPPQGVSAERDKIASSVDADIAGDLYRATNRAVPADQATVSDAGVIREHPLADSGSRHRSMAELRERTIDLKSNPRYQVAFAVAAQLGRQVDQFLDAIPPVRHASSQKSAIAKVPLLPELFLPADYSRKIVISRMQADTRKQYQAALESNPAIAPVLFYSFLRARYARELGAEGGAEGAVNEVLDAERKRLEDLLEAVLRGKTISTVSFDDVAEMRSLKQTLSEVRMAREKKIIAGAYEDLPGWAESEAKKAFDDLPSTPSRALVAALERWDASSNASKLINARRDLIAGYRPVSDPIQWLSHAENSGHINFTPALTGALDNALDSIKRVRRDLAPNVGNDAVRFFTRCSQAAATCFAKLSAAYIRKSEMDGGPRRPENFKEVSKTNDRRILEASLDFQGDLRHRPERSGGPFYFVYEDSASEAPPAAYSTRYAGYGDALEEGLPVVTLGERPERHRRDRYSSMEERSYHERLSEVSALMNTLRGAEPPQGV